MGSKVKLKQRRKKQINASKKVFRKKQEELSDIRKKANKLALENTNEEAAEKKLESRITAGSAVPNPAPAPGTAPAGAVPAAVTYGPERYQTSLPPDMLGYQPYNNIKGQLTKKENKYTESMETIIAKIKKSPSSAHKDKESLVRSLHLVDLMIWQLESFIKSNQNPPLGDNFFEKWINKEKNNFGFENVTLQNGRTIPIKDAFDRKAKQLLFGINNADARFDPNGPNPNIVFDPNADVTASLYDIRNHLHHAIENSLMLTEDNLLNLSDRSITDDRIEKEEGILQAELEASYANKIANYGLSTANDTSSITPAGGPRQNINGKASNITDNQVQINEDTVLRGPNRDSAPAKLIKVTHTITKRDGQVTLRIKLNKNDFKDISDAECYKLAIKLVENMRSITKQPICMKNAIPEPLVKAIAVYCHHMGYPYQDHTYVVQPHMSALEQKIRNFTKSKGFPVSNDLNYEATPRDLQKFRNKLKEMQKAEEIANSNGGRRIPEPDSNNGWKNETLSDWFPNMTQGQKDALYTGKSKKELRELEDKVIEITPRRSSKKLR